ncbi:MAG: D-2-hydroxyacid dehydrogenase [Spirochaetaceae bacterium]|nr:D-2-hydroxyacid dehydrogenase [Spirochaetaceae bacterium]
MEKALVLFKTESDFRDRLQERLYGIEVVFNESGDTRRIDPQTAADTVIIFGNPPADFLKGCPKLRWVQLQSAGANGFIGGELRNGVLLTCATGGYGHAVSEHITALTLALCKKLHLYRDEQNRKRWRPRGEVKSIQGSTVLVLGMGDIGTEYARRMKGLGAYIIGVRRTEHPKPEYVDQQFLSDKLDELLPKADVVSMVLPGVKATEGIMNRERLNKMKSGAIIVNAGRGSAIDVEALCDLLESGHLGGAGLDVTDPEPLPPEHRLWSIENAFITPHVAGGRYMAETGRYIMELNLENAVRFMKGESLKSLVDMKTGYALRN